MKAVIIGENGLEVTDVTKPEPKANEVLTKVATCGLNRADVLMARGAFHGAQGGSGTVMGMEWAGEVEAVGTDVSNVAVGDRVMCTGAAGYAEYAVSDYGRTMKIPGNNMSYEQAATMPIALHTMHNAVVTQGRLQKGHNVLIQGASSGVGLMAMQIAKHMGAAQVFGTSTNDGRRAKLTKHGADISLDPGDPGWVDAVKNGDTGGGEVTVTFFGGMDPSLYTDIRDMRGGKRKPKICNAETPLRTWGYHQEYATPGDILEWKMTKNPPSGSSGFQIRLKVSQMLDGFRPGRIVRAKGPWTYVLVPQDECIMTAEDLKSSRRMVLP